LDFGSDISPNILTSQLIDNEVKDILHHIPDQHKKSKKGKNLDLCTLSWVLQTRNAAVL